MKNFKKTTGGRPGGWLLLLLAAALFTCEKTPDHCGAGADNLLLDRETQFCFQNQTYRKCGGKEYDPITEGCCEDSKDVCKKCGDNSLVPADAPCITYTLMVIARDSGRVTGSGTFVLGTDAAISANANSGYIFTGWTVTNGTAEIDKANDPVTTVKLSGNATVEAQFVPGFVDERDKRPYRTVTIGGKRWMAENLNYDTADGNGSWCYDNAPDSCAKYGRLYDWNTAEKACPSGWRLPDSDDWEKLAEAAGGEYITSDDAAWWTVAGEMLKSETGWIDSDESSGVDKYGFSALSGGRHGGCGDRTFCTAAGDSGYWWSAEDYGDWAVSWSMHYSTANMNRNGSSKSWGFSVRCVAAD